MKKAFILTALIVSISVSGQKKIINLPDIPGYVTLKCDFHLHTVFSDGDPWPTVRIDEAIRDGLDAIAITDHLEYTPKKDYIPNDFDAAWKICEQYAKERNLILVHGTEITRKMPPGHFCALFIKNASLIARDSVWDSFEEAIKQGAFIQWNHPGWKAQQPDGIPRMYEIHKQMIRNGWLHGVEYFNYNEYYPKVFTMCEENNLALMGNSDAHGSISELYRDEGYSRRPMTIVFAKERTGNSLKEAMFARRTMVYFNDKLVAREDLARIFFNSCITVNKPYYEDNRNVYVEVINRSDVPFYLVNGTQAPGSVTLAANSVTRIVINKKVTSPLIYDVRNIITGEDKVLRTELKF